MSEETPMTEIRLTEKFPRCGFDDDPYTLVENHGGEPKWVIYSVDGDIVLKSNDPGVPSALSYSDIWNLLAVRVKGFTDGFDFGYQSGKRSARAEMRRALGID